MKARLCIYNDRYDVSEMIVNQLANDFLVTSQQRRRSIFRDAWYLQQFDLVHTSNPQAGLLVCLIAKFCFRIRYTITLNGLAWVEYQEMPTLLRWASFSILWLGLHYTDHLFPLSIFTKEEYLKKFPFLKKREITIPYLSYTPLQPCSQPSTGHQIITVTSFKYRHKCFPLLNLRPILANLPERYTFLIIGKDGPYRKVFEKLYIDEPRVKILTNVEDMHTYYCRSRIYLHYSNLDTLGRSILEAELLKLPCVVVEGYHGSSEAIPGQTVKNDPVAIAEALLEAEKQSDKDSELIAIWVKANFSPSVVAENYKKGFFRALVRDRN